MHRWFESSSGVFTQSAITSFNNPRHIVLLLVFAILYFAVNTVLAQSKSTSVASPSVSAIAAADKEGWQLVDTSFGKLSFTEIKNHPKRKGILDELPTNTYEAYDAWSEWKIQAAINRVNSERAWELAAIKEGDATAWRKEAAIEKIITQIPQVIPLYESRIASKWKLSQQDKKMLEYVLLIWKPPEWIPRIQKILDNPQNFTIE